MSKPVCHQGAQTDIYNLKWLKFRAKMYVVTPFMRSGDWHKQFLIREKKVESRTEGENRNAEPQAGFNKAGAKEKSRLRPTSGGVPFIFRHDSLTVFPAAPVPTCNTLLT